MRIPKALRPLRHAAAGLEPNKTLYHPVVLGSTSPPSLFGPIKPSSPLGPYLAHSGMQPRGLMEGALAEAETDGGAADEPTTVNVKLPDETPTTWQALMESVTACFAHVCDDYGGHAVPQPLLPGRRRACKVRRLARHALGV